MLIAAGCAAACITRLRFATSPIALHPVVWRKALESGKGDAVERAIATEPAASWERELSVALHEPNPELRAGLVNEQLRELDFRLTRWERVPRVCASIASSAGFLLGSLVLRFGLVAAGNGPEEGRGDVINGVVVQAISVAAFGVAGATFAVATQYRARKAARAFQQAADALVEALESSKL